MRTVTYLNSNLRNGSIIRWPEQCFPLPVYIAPCTFYSVSQADRYAYRGMVTDALNVWESVGEGKFSFFIVNNLNDSQMNVEWRRVDRKSLGNCTFSYNKNSSLYSAEVSIGISDGILHRQYMDENEVFHTILHEIGHALGLGHSDDDRDIMYTPHKYGSVSLSNRDINSVRWLYRLPSGADVSVLNSRYGINCSSIDEAITKISGGNNPSEFQKMLNASQLPSRNLTEENDKIAEIKKFQMSIQNIRLPKEITDKFKDM